MFYEHSHWYAPQPSCLTHNSTQSLWLGSLSMQNELGIGIALFLSCSLHFFALFLFGSWPSANHINVPLFEISARLMSFNLHLAVFSLSSVSERGRHRGEREREGDNVWDWAPDRGPIWLWRSVHNLTFIYIWMPFSIAQLHKSIVYGSAWVVAQQQQQDEQNTKEIFICIYMYMKEKNLIIFNI